MVSSYAPHFGEEDPLVGSHGSGTIFFTHCNLYCIFCQNYEISHGGEGEEVSVEDLAAMMLVLQKRGCHNINFVTPSHQVYQILAALPAAIAGGLSVPLVYNTGGYDALETLRLLDGVVDIYMPDFKFWDPRVARDLCQAEDYPEIARQAVKEMHRQVGDLVVDEQGVARRGLLVRHLVLPDGLAGTREIMDFLAREISPEYLRQRHGPISALRPGRGAPVLTKISHGPGARTGSAAWPGRRASPGWTGGKNSSAGCKRNGIVGAHLVCAQEGGPAGPPLRTFEGFR